MIVKRKIDRWIDVKQKINLERDRRDRQMNKQFGNQTAKRIDIIMSRLIDR